MAKLNISHYFEIDVGDETYTGEFTDLTKKQIKETNKLIPDDTLKQLKKLNRKLRLADSEKQRVKIEEQIDALEEVLKDHDIDDVYKRRLELSVSGDDKKSILEVGDKYGHKRVFETIIQDISERKEKN